MALNYTLAEDKIRSAFNEKIVRPLGREFRKEIEDEKWRWTDGALRDIVDTGALRDSQKIEREGDTVYFSWNVPYALYVHEGVVLRSGAVLPARPWTRTAIENIIS
jgi:hypothetical protein